MKKLLVTVAIAAIFAISYADMKSDSLAAHNDERNANGVPSLTWSDSLAQTAQAYAQVMANTGTTSHSKGRVNVGENLAWGKGKNVDTTFLAGLWLDEKEYYIPNVDFPDCSNTGSWHDVAHYTQLMWEETTEVGCGLAQSSSGMNYYVCHYSPQGNMDGEPVYTEAEPIVSTPDETDPVTTDSTTTDSTTTDPATTDSATVDPATADPVATDPVTSDPTPTATTQTDDSQDQFITDSLAVHNNERTAYGVPALTWSSSLAQTAQAYAEVQASTGTTSHSKGRVNVGENLAWGSGSGTTTLSLAGRWLAEKKYFIAGRDFPNCSTTGNWDSVAHYTQMMWRKTTQVGCGIAKSRSGMNYYVCHYSPQGNINGNPVY